MLGGMKYSLRGRAGVVTNQEIQGVAEKTGLEVEEVLTKLREALMLFEYVNRNEVKEG